MISVSDAKGSLNPFLLVDHIKYDIDFKKKHPDFFYPDGTVVYVGSQGSGKSLRAYEYVANLMKSYPKCKLVTNLDLRDYPVVSFDDFMRDRLDIYATIRLDKIYSTYKTANGKYCDAIDVAYDKAVFDRFYKVYMRENRVFPFYNNDDLRRYKNGEYGVIFFIDEIALYMNNLESKNLNMAVMGQLAQQRKQRIHIVSTTQRIGRTCKQLREQYPSIMRCTNYFRYVEKVELLNNCDIQDDGHVTADVDHVFWSFIDVGSFGAYDTYAILKKGAFCSGEKSLDLFFTSVLNSVKEEGEDCD